LLSVSVADDRDREGALRCLGTCLLFRGLPVQDVGRLLRDWEWLELRRGEVLYSQGDPSRGVCVIASGRIRIVRHGPEGRELTLDYFGAGDAIGECSLVDGRHHAQAVAVERVHVLRIPGPAIERILSEVAVVARQLVGLVAARRLDLEERLEALLSRPVESRIARFLARAAERHGVPDPRGRLIGVRFTHHEIASCVGATRETVTIVLGDLRRRGLLDIDHRRIVVRDATALAALY